MTLRLTSVGPGATIQDGGRFGLLRFGVTPAGPMDWAAFETANRALGNRPDAAALEIGPGGVAIDVDAPLLIAFAGGGFAWTRGDTLLPADARILLQPGESLRGRATGWGRFAYCAVPGGVDVPAVMGSRSTHTRSQLGGLEGRLLQAGDRLRAAADIAPMGNLAPMDDAAIEADWLQRSDAPIRVILGPQDDHFTPQAIITLQEASFKLSGAADRMAYKFAGPKLAHARDFNIVSDGIALGAIQVAGDGQAIVLMADRQPTGGYPKIAHVCRADIGRLAQTQPGASCRFHVLDAEAARAALMALEDRVAGTLDHLVALRRAPTAASLMRLNLIGGVTDGGDADLIVLPKPRSLA